MKHTEIVKQLRKNGLEVTLKRELHKTVAGDFNMYKAELYFDGETGVGYDTKCYLKALNKAQSVLAKKFPIDKREIFSIGIVEKGISAGRRK